MKNALAIFSAWLLAVVLLPLTFPIACGMVVVWAAKLQGISKGLDILRDAYPRKPSAPSSEGLDS